MDKADGILGGLNWLTRQEPTVLFALILAGVTIIVLLRVNRFAKGWLERACWVVVILATYILIIGFSHSLYAKHKVKERLTTLTSSERAVLKDILERENLATYHNKGSGIAWGLVKDGILYKAADRSEFIETFNLHHWIFRYLKERPELLKSST